MDVDCLVFALEEMQDDHGHCEILGRGEGSSFGSTINRFSDGG
jgi:hypothetical protein